MEQKKVEATKNGEVHFCKNCNKVQPVELVFFNPDEDEEPTLLICQVCNEAIGFIENL